MKNQRTILLGSLVACLLLIMPSLWTGVGFTQGKPDQSQISLSADSNKKSYVLGEPVSIRFAFHNSGGTPVQVSGFGVETGALKIYIASGEEGEFKEHFGSGWGRKHGKYVTLESGMSHELRPVTLLWNGTPKVAPTHEALVGKVTTEYVFQKPGTYMVKGRSYFGGNGTPIDSSPLSIEITAPEGNDAEVWKQISGDREVAFLLQKGTFDTEEKDRKQQLIAKVEQILSEHPESVYSSYLRPNLEKYKADEVRRKAMLEKATIRKN